MKHNPTMLGNFIALLATAHKDQVDKGGKPYFLHCMRVAMRLRTEDQELMAMAIGHDGIEDGVVTEEQLIAVGATPRIMAGLRLLTLDPAEPYQDYIERISTSYDAIRVKIEDIRDNSDITRMKPLSSATTYDIENQEAKRIVRIHKYQTAYMYLTEARKRFEIL